MMNRAVLALLLLLPLAASAQTDPLRNVSGTTPATAATPWIQTGGEGWTFFHGYDVHVSYLSQTGPEEQKNEVLSTNWLAAGVKKDLGDRAFVLARGRVSLEPYTIGDDGYPQLFQYVSPLSNGGAALVDRMRPQDLIGEAAVQAGYRPTDSTLVSLYAGIVGDPALGAAPWQLRSSGVDFAEAPFAYDIQESMHSATSVVTATLASRWITLEGSAFHDAIPSGDYTSIDNGDMDSHSMRVTLTPSANFAIQASKGTLGEGVRERDITSASVSYGGPMVAVTALWTRREMQTEPAPEAETAYGFEVALRGSRNTLMARAEHVDRPAGFPLDPNGPGLETATHYTAGYIFDVVTASSWRAGVGLNIDYRTKTRELEEVYGHKPQGIYAFVRLRSTGL